MLIDELKKIKMESRQVDPERSDGDAWSALMMAEKV